MSPTLKTNKNTTIKVASNPNPGKLNPINAKQANKAAIKAANNATKKSAPKNNGQKKQNFKGTIIRQAPSHVIKDITNNNNVGIILMDDDTMINIMKQSGPLAPSCEYQVHYWALVFRAQSKLDQSIIDICIPTVLYNYKQEVSGARIDFHLEDVESMSDSLRPIHENVSNDLFASGLHEQIADLFDSEIFDLSILSTNLNSIHKHPGTHASQSFSGTDLDKDPEHDTGIVFPLTSTSIENQPNFAGIMAHDYGDTENKVAHYEYRLVSGKIDKTQPKSQITYRKGKCYCYVRARNEKRSMFSDANVFFGIQAPTRKPYHKSKDLDPDKNNSEFFKSLHHIWDNSSFKQDIELVLPDNVARKKYVQGTYANSHAYGDDYNLYGGYNTNITGANKTATSKMMQTGTESKKKPKVQSNFLSSKMSEEEYIAKSKSLAFLGDVEVLSVGFYALKAAYEKIANHYYDDDKTDSSPAMNLPELRKDYVKIKGFLKEEIAAYEKRESLKKQYAGEEEEMVIVHDSMNTEDKPETEETKETEDNSKFNQHSGFDIQQYYTTLQELSNEIHNNITAFTAEDYDTMSDFLVEEAQYGRTFVDGLSRERLRMIYLEEYTEFFG